MTATEVTLKNGTTAPDVAVSAIMLALDDLLQNEPIAFYELVQVCRDRRHEPFGNAGAKLKARGMLQGHGQPHELVRDVVLSAVTGEGFDLILGSPYPEA